MRAAIINLSAPNYNLGTHKLSDWFVGRGWNTTPFEGDPGIFLQGFDLVAVSAIFSWDVPKGLEIAFRTPASTDLWAGGPGFFKLGPWWKERTQRDAIIGLAEPFERQRGNYRETFASRGCPVGCWFCIVPQLEGKQFTLDWEFQPAPILCDNNLSALPVEFQEHIIRRYVESGTRLLDANSGFEPKTFDEGTYERWRGILKGPWRFAYDYLAERSLVRRMMEVLKAESPKRKRVYVLIGNEPFETCLQRAREVIEWGGEPYCQPVLPLDALDRRQFILRYDWTAENLVHFARYFNRFLWKCTSLQGYQCGTLRPFAEQRSPAASALELLRGG